MKLIASFLTTIRNKLLPLIFIVRTTADKVWIKFQSLSVRERRVAVVTFLVLLSIGVAKGVVDPLQSSIKALDQKILTQEKQALAQLRSMGMKAKVDESYLRLVESIDSPAFGVPLPRCAHVMQSHACAYHWTGSLK